jgi:hypothetical protein
MYLSVGEAVFGAVAVTTDKFFALPITTVLGEFFALPITTVLDEIGFGGTSDHDGAVIGTIVDVGAPDLMLDRDSVSVSAPPSREAIATRFLLEVVAIRFLVGACPAANAIGSADEAKNGTHNSDTRTRFTTLEKKYSAELLVIMISSFLRLKILFRSENRLAS